MGSSQRGLSRGRIDRSRSNSIGLDHQHAFVSAPRLHFGAHRGSLYELGTLAPGQSVRLGPTVRRSELKTFLTRTVFSEGANFSQQGTPYSQSSTEPAYILQRMMFYEAAGGRHYTHLSNSYQEFVDLSNLLKTGRAILVAQTPAPAAEGHEGAELLGDGKPLAGRQDQHGTIYRFIFP